MIKKLFFFMLFVSPHTFFCQQPVLSVQRFDYIWDAYLNGSNGPGKKRVILPSEDWARQSIANSFTRALQQRWNVKVPAMDLSVKSLSFFSSAPKFNTKLKDKEPGTWYLFLQIFDMGTPYQNLYENDTRATALELKCKLISGDNDSVILDRSLTVKIFKDTVQANQIVLTRLPAYPPYFLKSFDSIATWLFQPETENQKTLSLKPACVFSEASTTTVPIAQLSFESDKENIHHLTQPSFHLRMTGPAYEKTKTRRNTGGNIASGVLTIFTGVGTNKSKTYEYRADFPFEDKDSVFHCFINFAERETAEREREKTKNPDGSKSYSINSGSYSLSDRYIDPGSIHAITLGQDTLVTFRITNLNNSHEQKNYTRMWDGNDSSTIRDLPNEWNNNSENVSFILSGESGNSQFSMKTKNGILVKEFYTGDQLVLIMYGKKIPRAATLFQPVSEMQLKIFTMLSSLPYDYFNYGAY